EQREEGEGGVVGQGVRLGGWGGVMYFLMLGTAAVAVSWPWIVEKCDEWTDRLLKALPFGDRLAGAYDSADYAMAAVLDGIRNALAGVIPGYVKNWTDALADEPFLTILLILIIIGLW